MPSTTLDERAHRAAGALRDAVAARVDMAPPERRWRPLRPLAVAAALALIVAGAVVIESTRPGVPPTTTPTVLLRIPTGSTGLVVGSWMWVTGAPLGPGRFGVALIDPSNRAVVHVFSLEGSITGTAESSGVLYAVTAAPNGSRLYALDAGSRTTRQWPLPVARPGPVAVLNGVVWVADQEGGPAVWAIDPLTGKAVRHLLPVPEQLGIATPHQATGRRSSQPGLVVSELHAAGGTLLAVETTTDHGPRASSAVEVESDGSYSRVWFSGPSFVATTEDSSFWSLDGHGNITLSRQVTERTMAGIPPQQWQIVPYSVAYLLPSNWNGDAIAATADTLIVGDGRTFWRIDRHTARLDRLASLANPAQSWAVGADGSLILLDRRASLLERVVDPGPSGHGRNVCGPRSPGPQPPNPVPIGCSSSADNPNHG